MKKLKIALVQKPPVFLNLKESVELVKKYTKECSRNGAEVVCFPETWLPGYPLWFDVSPNAALWDHKPAKELFRILFDNSISINDALFKEIKACAVESSITNIIGVNEKLGGTLYNSIFYFGSDGDFKVHRKLIPTYTERLVWGRGDGSTLEGLQTEKGLIGALVCWEHWMPEVRYVMHRQNEILHAALWPSVKDTHIIASRHYAFEGQTFVAASGFIISKKQVLEGYDSLGEKSAAREILENITAGDDELILKGGSAVIAPDSSFITEPLYNKEAIITAEIDLDLIAEGKMALDTSGHYSRPDIFELNVNKKGGIN